VIYDEVNYQLLKDYLNSDDYTNIHPLNRAQLLDDSLNLARAGLLNYSAALDLTTYLAAETDFIPWVSYFRALTFLNARFAGTDDYEIFKVSQSAWWHCGIDKIDTDAFHTSYYARYKTSENTRYYIQKILRNTIQLQNIS
jgi:hypothetical protein